MSLQVLRSAVAGRICSGHAAGSAQGRFLRSSASDRFKKLDEAKRADIMKGVRQLREKMQKDFANDVEMLKETLTNHSYFDSLAAMFWLSVSAGKWHGRTMKREGMHS